MPFFKYLYAKPYLLLFLTTLFWAGNAIAGKLAVGHISPFLLTTLRWLLACMLIVPIALPYLKADRVLIQQDWWFLFLLGGTGFTVFNNLMYQALQTTSAMNVAIIQAALPLSIFALNFVVYRVSATRYQLLGFPVTVIGVLVIVSQAKWEIIKALSFVRGDLMMLLAITVYGAYSVMLRRKPDIHWLSLISVLSLSAVLASLPFLIYEYQNGRLVLPDKTAYLIVIYTALFASLISQVFWIRGIELIGSNASSLFINLVPLLGTFLAIILLSEALHWHHVIGLILIVGGIILAQKNVRSPAP